MTITDRINDSSRIARRIHQLPLHSSCWNAVSTLPRFWKINYLNTTNRRLGNPTSLRVVVRDRCICTIRRPAIVLIKAATSLLPAARWISTLIRLRAPSCQKRTKRQCPKSLVDHHEFPQSKVMKKSGANHMEEFVLQGARLSRALLALSCYPDNVTRTVPPPSARPRLGRANVSICLICERISQDGLRVPGKHAPPRPSYRPGSRGTWDIGTRQTGNRTDTL